MHPQPWKQNVSKSWLEEWPLLPVCTGLPSSLAVQRTATLHTVKTTIDVFRCASFSSFKAKKFP